MIGNRWDNRRDLRGWYEKTNDTWGNVLDRTAATYPDVEAIVYRGRRVTFGRLKEYVDSFARGLLGIGIRRGDNVALWMTNCPEWVIAQFAIYKIGARMVAVNTRYCLSELDYVLKQSDCKAVVMNDLFLGKTDAIAMIDKVVPAREHLKGRKARPDDDVNVEHIVCLSDRKKKYDGTHDFADVLGLGQAHARDGVLNEAAAQVSPSDIMSIQYTSGTTGFPKGVMCTHRSNMASFFCTGVGFGYRNGQDRMIVALPFFTNYGVLACSATSVLFGVTMAVLDQYDPEECLKIIETERITISHGSDNMYINILNHEKFSKYDTSTLRAGLMGGGHNPVEVIKEVMKIVPELSLGYGLTENSGMGSIVLYDDPMEKRLHTSGRPIPYTRLCIKDIKTNEILSGDRNGEICAHDVQPNSSVMVGYYRKEKETREAIDEGGWLHTGDLGVLDDDGYLVVTGRLKDMFTSGGSNVYPAEIENYLHTHAAIKHAAVVGVPDEIKGAVPMAYIVLKDGSRLGGEDVIAYCRNKIASYKVPRQVEFVHELPLTSSGKVQKYELRERAIKALGLEEVSRKRKM